MLITTKWETLKPTCNDSVKSFYGKAKYMLCSGKIYLRSYDTDVAHIDTKDRSAHIYGWYSVTTARHVNSFLKQNGFYSISKHGMTGGAILR